jgi:sugar phosphate isomerase/epimerase
MKPSVAIADRRSRAQSCFRKWCSNLGLMPDVFHMNIEDAQIGATLVQYAHLIRYVHLADSNRLAPGQGHLDFDDVFDGLKSGGFDGWVAIEILPRPDPDTAALQAAEYVLPRVQAYNRAMGAEVSGLELRGRSRIVPTPQI